ncbi:hypothetical protein THAOC_26503, partial [Thalassiosira oceanica]
SEVLRKEFGERGPTSAKQEPRRQAPPTLALASRSRRRRSEGRVTSINDGRWDDSPCRAEVLEVKRRKTLSNPRWGDDVRDKRPG